jgi:hypothetical protein
MRKIITALIGGATAAVAVVTLMAAPSSAVENGVDLTLLSDRGWLCLNVVHAVHCVAPGVVEKIGTTPAFTALVFDTMDPQDSNAALLGTEFNIRADLFRLGRPCPTDPTPSGDPGQYTYLPDLGLPFNYYACHRFDTNVF